MAKIRKAVFRSGIVMMSLLAAIVLSSSVAYAQECIAKGVDNDVRAEGVTEEVGMIELRCGTGDRTGLVFDLADELDLTITLNAPITNPISRTRTIVTGDNGLTYTDGADTPGDPVLGDAEDYQGSDKEELSEDGMTISWELTTEDLGITTTTGTSVYIGGILVNASVVGHREDVTATVRVNGQAAHAGTLKLSDVTTGLAVTVNESNDENALRGFQCNTVPSTGSKSLVSTIFFVEGFASALRDLDSIVVGLSGVPEGVTVTPSEMGTGVGTYTAAQATDSADDATDFAGQDLAPLTLDTDSATSGVNVDDDDNVTVAISASGAGEITYMLDDDDATTTDIMEGTNSMLAKEWNTVTLTFTWEAGAPDLGTVSVSVSYDPVGGSRIPRYVAGAAQAVLQIVDCDSSMTFPFVTNMYGYDTGIALTNTSDEDGTCTLSFGGATNNPADMEMGIAAESVVTFAVSGEAPEFQGYITASCDFRDGKGFVFISNGFGSMGGPTAAQGYLVGTDIAESD